MYGYLRLGCRIVLGMHSLSVATIICRSCLVSFEKLWVEIAALSVVRRLRSGSGVVEAYSCHWSGSPDLRQRGFDVAISARLSECVRQVTPVDERILHLRLE